MEKPNIQIEVVKPCSETLPSGAKRSFPVGWIGVVPYDLAVQFCEADQATALSVEGDDEFSPAEFAVLKDAAREILQQPVDLVEPQPVDPPASDDQAQQPVDQVDAGAGEQPEQQPVEPAAETPAEQPKPAATARNKGGRR